MEETKSVGKAKGASTLTPNFFHPSQEECNEIDEALITQVLAEQAAEAKQKTKKLAAVRKGKDEKQTSLL